MVGALRVLGARISDGGPEWVVDGSSFGTSAGDIDVGNAGTVARFAPPVAGLTIGRVRFDGDERMRERPLGPLVAALRNLGITVEDDGRGAVPLTVLGTGDVRGGAVTVDASSSSQLISGLLLAGPRFDEGVEIQHVGSPVPSAPHLAMTTTVLRAAGAVVHDEQLDRWRVLPGPLVPRDWDIEPDLSGAAAFLAAAAVTGGRVRIPHWPTTTTQPGGWLPDLLAAMGASWTRDGEALVLTRTDRLSGIEADLHAVGELTPVLTAVAALADSPSRFWGIAHLRRHETDRLAALAREINELGGDVRETDDGLEIRPRPLHGGTVRTYEDHRIAMAAAVLGLTVDGVVVENIGTTDKTMPKFPERWMEMVGSGGAR